MRVSPSGAWYTTLLRIVNTRLPQALEVKGGPNFVVQISIRAHSTAHHKGTQPSASRGRSGLYLQRPGSAER
jgi:hypothetical protein